MPCVVAPSTGFRLLNARESRAALQRWPRCGEARDPHAGGLIVLRVEVGPALRRVIPKSPVFG